MLIKILLAMAVGFCSRFYSDIRTVKCGAIHDTVKCLPQLIWCDCHFHGVIYYANSVVCTLHFLQCTSVLSLTRLLILRNWQICIDLLHPH